MIVTLASEALLRGVAIMFGVVFVVLMIGDILADWLSRFYRDW